MRTLCSVRPALLSLALAFAVCACTQATQTKQATSDHAPQPSGAAANKTAPPSGSAATAGSATAAGPAAAAGSSSTAGPAAAAGSSSTAGSAPASSSPGSKHHSGRAPMVSPKNPQYHHVEGTYLKNACSTDRDCFVGGCAGEICSAQPHAISNCIMPRGGWASKGGSCGCVAGQCIWYKGAGGGAHRSSGAAHPAGAGARGGTIPKVGRQCNHGKCAHGLTCVSYYGVAGRRAPKHSSCEIRCGGKRPRCPHGLACVTIADGPGRVCRPSRHR